MHTIYSVVITSACVSCSADCGFFLYTSSLRKYIIVIFFVNIFSLQCNIEY